MVSIRQALAEASLPGDAGRLEAEVLLCHCLGESRSYLYTWPERELAEDCLARYRALLAARREGKPVAYLTGRREFWSLELAVDEHTLIPRPETEVLVDWALNLELQADARVADWGTGSGAIALALASERPAWTVIASDRSAAALHVAASNRDELGLQNVELLQASWGDGQVGFGYQLIASNPPYVAEGDAHLEQGDLRFEPDSALVSGGDGLDDICQITRDAFACLSPGGWLLMEHGFDQAAAVRDLLAASGYVEVATREVPAGQERISGGRRP